MKKALVLASVASMIDQFNMPNIMLLLRLGYQVDVATNFQQSGSISKERTEDLKRRLREMGVNVIDIPIPRSIFAIKKIVKSYKQLKAICNTNAYTLIHCHSPIGGAIARLAAKKARVQLGTKVIYTAHGFHFYKGASKKNWLFFYPIEKYCSKFTDVLITINREDYLLASKKMRAKRVEYFPGVGVDLSKFSRDTLDGDSIENKREELGVLKHDLVLLSVGELNENKNHEIIVRLLSQLKMDNIKYLIVGKGALQPKIQKNIDNLGLQDNVRLLGYRTDIAEIYQIADVFVFPSYREGLSVSLMEAMSSGLPCVVSKIRGNTDLIEEQKGGFLCLPNDEKSFLSTLKILLENEELRRSFGAYNREKVQGFSVETVLERTKEIYSCT